MRPGVLAKTIEGATAAPLTHDAAVTSGVTGVTGVHSTASNVTASVASVSDVSSQPSGSSVGQPTRAESNVAVTDTVSPAAYGPSGSTV